MFQTNKTSIHYQVVDNPLLVTSFGILIAKGIIRKENAREILIEIGIFKSIDPPKQVMHNPLFKEVVIEAKNWKSPNDGIYKMFGSWWITETSLRCDLLAAHFTEDEQRAIADRIKNRRARLPLDPD